MKYGKLCLLVSMLMAQGTDLGAQPNDGSDFYELLTACFGDCAVVLRPLLSLVAKDLYIHKKDDDLIGHDGYYNTTDSAQQMSRISFQKDPEQLKLQLVEQLRLQLVERLRTRVIFQKLVNNSIEEEEEKMDRGFHKWSFPVDDIRKYKTKISSSISKKPTDSFCTIS